MFIHFINWVTRRGKIATLLDVETGHSEYANVNSDYMEKVFKEIISTDIDDNTPINRMCDIQKRYNDANDWCHVIITSGDNVLFEGIYKIGSMWVDE